MTKNLLIFLIVTVFSVTLPYYALCQTKDELRVIKVELETVKITLPSDWERRAEADSNTGVLFLRKIPNSLLGINIFPMGNVSSFACNSESYQRLFLSKIRETAEKGDEIEEAISYFQTPTLMVTRVVDKQEDGTQGKIRDIHFVRDCKYYLVTFGCDKTNFEVQWKDMEQRIRGMEFSK